MFDMRLTIDVTDLQGDYPDNFPGRRLHYVILYITIL